MAVPLLNLGHVRPIILPSYTLFQLIGRVATLQLFTAAFFAIKDCCTEIKIALDAKIKFLLLFSDHKDERQVRVLRESLGNAFQSFPHSG